MEYTASAYPILYPTSSLNEVPKELLMGGDIERTLHIAGVKEATPAKLQEWQDERFKRASVESELSMDGLLSKLNPDDLKLKAGIIPHDRNQRTIDLSNKIMSKVKADDIDEIELTKLRVRAARKENDREREQRVKIDFDALNFSRISNEARKQITEIVKQDLENKMKVVEENTPEINEDIKSK